MTANPPYSQEQPNPAKRLYNRGWLGLIPLIGAFIGVWLLTVGITHKDRKLILIAVGCILFTVLLYGSMFLYMRSDSARKFMASAQPPMLNTVVKAIEFYKIQNSHYPDSIQQVVNGGEIVFIYDQMSVRGFGDMQPYFYQRIDSGYTLYSRGIDGQLHTDDDIFPSLSTKNIGLIKTNK